MRKYTVLSTLGFPPGRVLGLSMAQAAPRAHALRAIRAAEGGRVGTYEVVSPVEFKAGEQICIDADLSKRLATQLEPDEGARKRTAGAGRNAPEQADAVVNAG